MRQELNDFINAVKDACSKDKDSMVLELAKLGYNLNPSLSKEELINDLSLWIIGNNFKELDFFDYLGIKNIAKYLRDNNFLNLYYVIDAIKNIYEEENFVDKITVDQFLEKYHISSRSKLKNVLTDDMSENVNVPLGSLEPFIDLFFYDVVDRENKDNLYCSLLYQATQKMASELNKVIVAF